MNELDFATRILLPWHQPTAQRLWDDWMSALDADLQARPDRYQAACGVNPSSAGLWAIIERWHQTDPNDQAAIDALDAECAAYMQAHPSAYDPIGDTFAEVDTSLADDLEAAYRCLWGEP